MPSFYPEGNTVLASDNELRTLHKICSLVAAGGGGGAPLLTGAGSPQGSVSGSIGQRYRDTVSGNFWTNIDGGTGWAAG